MKKFKNIIIYTLLIFSFGALSAFSTTQLSVSLDNNEASEYATYDLDFKTTVGQYIKIFYGELIVTLPLGFETDRLDSIEVNDGFKHFSYSVRDIVIEDNLIHLYLKLDINFSTAELESYYPSSSHLLDINVRLHQLKNPSEEGDYQISLEGRSYYKKLVIGPLTSNLFSIVKTTTSINSIVVTPSENLQLMAGAEQIFSATAYDENGNIVEGVLFDWSLGDCTTCIGELTDSTLLATTVGEGVVYASAGEITGSSGFITVTPGELEQMVLQVDETQFVGNVMRNSSLTLYDAYQNLKTNYDLSETPIFMGLSSGLLSKNVLNNNDFIADGVISFEDNNIGYIGLSGINSLFADNRSISSNHVTLSFNNYDILDVQDSLGKTLNSINVGEPNNAKLLIQNNGNLKAESIKVSHYWKLSPDSVVSFEITPSEVQIVDEIELNLEYNSFTGTSDELIVTTESEFIYENDTIITTDEKSYPVLINSESNQLTIIPGSLTPLSVYAGSNVSFEFKVNLEGNQAYHFHGNESFFRLYDSSFSTTTNIFLDSDSLYPGENTLRSATISIQPEQVGKQLFAGVDLNYCIPDIADTVIIHETFQTPIEVFELPLVQILDLEVVSPNAPFVNSSQEIQFKATIANHSSTMLDSIPLHLKTVEGLSTIVQPLQTAYNVKAFDTISVLFDVVVAPDAQPLPESFLVDIYDEAIGDLSSINNSAYLIIEEKANLDISYRINGLENADGYVALYGDNIHLQFDIDNLGTSKISGGMYQLIVNGHNSNGPDTLTGTIDLESAIEFDYQAPLFDAVMQFDFRISDFPIDLNSNSAVSVENEAFEFTVRSVSNSAQLIVESVSSGSNLILPNRSKELFELVITNNSNSELNSIQIEHINLEFFTIDKSEIDARDIINVGNSQFYEDGNKLTIATIGGNQLMLSFESFVIAPQQTRIIQFVGEFKESSHKSILLEIENTSFKATFTDGPKIGQDATVSVLNGGNKILEYQVVFKGSSLPESFLIENNPCNPMISPVNFAFELSESAPIEFQIFTLTGEEVFSSYTEAGAVGASTGENMISWDGRNNSGEMVLNGVYIASIINKDTGDYARIKVAVVK